MEFKIAATAGGGMGVCARTGAVKSVERKAASKKIRISFIASTYNTIELQSQEALQKTKKTDAARGTTPCLSLRAHPDLTLTFG
jgi:hypothetical protein